MKTKNYNLMHMLLLAAMVFSLLSCSDGKTVIRGDGNIATVTKELELARNLNINFSGFGSIYLAQGDRQMVQIETDQNLHQYLNIEQRNDDLHIFTDEGVRFDATQLNVTITYPRELSELKVAGAVSVKADHTIISDRLNFDISGAADIDLSIAVKRLETRVAGSGRIKLAGKAQEHKISLSGATYLDCLDLETETTIVNLSGAGSARVNASQMLTANISGIGNIIYGGNPVERKFNISGLGTINPYNKETP